MSGFASSSVSQLCRLTDENPNRHYRKTSKLDSLHFPDATQFTPFCFWVSKGKYISRQRKRTSAKREKMPAPHIPKAGSVFSGISCFPTRAFVFLNFFLSYIYAIATHCSAFREVPHHMKTAILFFKISIKGIGSDVYVLQICFHNLSSLSWAIKQIKLQ